jgi:hypothetical protein
MRAFVVMPFSEDLSWVFDDVLAPLLRELNYEAIRADTTLNQQNLLADIIEGITESDVIIADLTGLNPNVMYELGLAHGLRRPVIMLTQSISTVPFDLRSYRLTAYTERYPDVEALKNVLRQTLEAHSRGDVRFGNPVDDFYPESPPSGSEHSDEPSPDDVPMRQLDFEEHFEQLAHTTSAQLQQVGSRAEEFSQFLNEVTNEANAIPSGDPAGTRKRRRLASSTAQAVDEYASDLQNATSPLMAQWGGMESTLDALLQRTRITTPEDVALPATL